MKGDQKRLLWPDVAKGIGIIAIIIGHMGINNINRIVFLFHVPLFYVISGYFLNPQKKFETMVRGKIKTLILPYIYTCVAMCVFGGLKAMLESQSSVSALKFWMFAALYGAGTTWENPFYIPQIGAIWFLLALFQGIVITWWCLQKIEKHFFVLLGLVGISLFISQYIWLPFSVLTGPIAAVYILLGYEARKLGFFTKTGFSFLSIGTSLVMLAIGAWKFNGLWLASNWYGNGIMDFACTICGVYVVVHLSRIISQKTKILSGVLSFYGKNSLLIMCVHLLELNLFPWVSVYEKLNCWGIIGHAADFVVMICKLVYVTLCVLIKIWFTDFVKKKGTKLV